MIVDSLKSEVMPGSQEESASPTGIAVPVMNARNDSRLDTRVGGNV